MLKQGMLGALVVCVEGRGPPQQFVDTAKAQTLHHTPRALPCGPKSRSCTIRGAGNTKATQAQGQRRLEPFIGGEGALSDNLPAAFQDGVVGGELGVGDQGHAL